jgi:hypothetical protein
VRGHEFKKFQLWTFLGAVCFGVWEVAAVPLSLPPLSFLVFDFVFHFAPTSMTMMMNQAVIMADAESGDNLLTSTAMHGGTQEPTHGLFFLMLRSGFAHFFLLQRCQMRMPI